MPTRLPVAAAALALLLPLALSGCSVHAFVRTSGTVAQQPSSSAAAYYLDTICPRNGAIYEFDDLRATRDLSALHAVAAAAAAASTKAAAGMRATTAPWPASIDPQIELLAQSLDLDATSYGEIAHATTLQNAWAVTFPGDTSAGDAKFIIRESLGLGDGQQVDDCVGHYGGAAADAGAGTV